LMLGKYFSKKNVTQMLNLLSEINPNYFFYQIPRNMQQYQYYFVFQ